MDTAADGALYQQIIDRVKKEISEGRLKPDSALPSFRQLAEDLLVSVITVKLHRAAVMRKMDASSLADLVRKSEALGVHAPPSTESSGR